MPSMWRWAGGDNSATVSGNTKQIVPLVLPTVIGKGDTIARILGRMVVQKAVASTGVNPFFRGLMLVDEGAVVAGVPSPKTDPEADWIWHAVGHLPPHDTVGDYGTVHMLIDVHGMRKVRGDQRLVYIAESDTADNLLYSCGVRVGIKMP